MKTPESQSAVNAQEAAKEGEIGFSWCQDLAIARSALRVNMIRNVQNRETALLLTNILFGWLIAPVAVVIMRWLDKRERKTSQSVEEENHGK